MHRYSEQKTQENKKEFIDNEHNSKESERDQGQFDSKYQFKFKVRFYHLNF